MLLKAEFEAQMSYLEPSIEAMLTAGEGDNDDDDKDNMMMNMTIMITIAKKMKGFIVKW